MNMNVDRWMAVAGIVIGLVGLAAAFWQWHESKRQGQIVYFFLHGAGGWTQLTDLQARKVNDIMAYLKPPKNPPKEPSAPEI
jgi:hypothetical protein